VGTFTFDVTAPAAVVTYSPTIGTWTSGDVVVTLQMTEPGTVTSVGRTATGTNAYSKTYSSNSSEVIDFEDLVGNTGNAAVNVTNIDTTAPSISSSYDPITPTNGKVTVTITGSDTGGSGLPADAYSFDGGNTWTGNNTKAYTDNQTNLPIAIRDAVGNVATGSVTFNNIDQTAPSVTVTANPSMSPTS
jgi:hypothetical protein